MPLDYAHSIRPSAGQSTHRAPVTSSTTVNDGCQGLNKVENRVPYLDGLRAVAILLVLFAHAQASVGFPLFLQQCAKLSPLNLGALGVDIFFVISGFIITHILLREEERVGRVSMVNFWKRRALRILPALVVYLSFVICLGLIHPQMSVSWVDVLMALTFSSGILAPERSWWLGHTWSLSIEEQFYLGWPLALRLMPRNRTRLFIMGGVFFRLPARPSTIGWEFLHVGCCPQTRATFWLVARWHYTAVLIRHLLVPAYPLGQ